MSPPRSRTRSTPARSAQVRPGAPTDELRGLLEPVVTGAGFELDDARRPQLGQAAHGPDGGRLRRRHDLDDIARLSRAASDELDRNEHLVGGSYTLEVTSPGVDRPLTRRGTGGEPACAWSPSGRSPVRRWATRSSPGGSARRARTP